MDFEMQSVEQARSEQLSSLFPGLLEQASNVYLSLNSIDEIDCLMPYSYNDLLTYLPFTEGFKKSVGYGGDCLKIDLRGRYGDELREKLGDQIEYVREVCWKISIYNAIKYLIEQGREIDLSYTEYQDGYIFEKLEDNIEEFCETYPNNSLFQNGVYHDLFESVLHNALKKKFKQIRTATSVFQIYSSRTTEEGEKIERGWFPDLLQIRASVAFMPMTVEGLKEKIEQNKLASKSKTDPGLELYLNFFHKHLRLCRKRMREEVLQIADSIGNVSELFNNWDQGCEKIAKIYFRIEDMFKLKHPFEGRYQYYKDRITSVLRVEEGDDEMNRAITKVVDLVYIYNE